MTHTRQWLEFAACRGMDPRIFEVDRQASPAEQKAAVERCQPTCGSCLVRISCMMEALETKEKENIWGGMAPRQRGIKPLPRRGVNAT